MRYTPSGDERSGGEVVSCESAVVVVQFALVVHEVTLNALLWPIQTQMKNVKHFMSFFEEVSFSGFFLWHFSFSHNLPEHNVYITSNTTALRNQHQSMNQ